MPGSRPGRSGASTSPSRADAPARGTAVSIAVRPEKIHLHWTAPDAGANALAGRLNAKAYFGDRSHYFVEVAGMDKLIAVARQNADRQFSESDAIGTAVWMTWKPEAASLLTESAERASSALEISPSPPEGGRGPG